MTSDKNKNSNTDDKNPTKKPVTGACKPCMPTARDTDDKKEKTTATKNPSLNQTSNASSCYAKCASPAAQQASSSATKTTVEPSDQTTKVGTCYKKCGPPHLQQDPSSAQPVSSSAPKTIVDPSTQTTKVGSCYAKCGPPSVRQDSTSTSTGSTTTAKAQVDLVNGTCRVKPLSVTNPHIEKMDEDILYHIALGNKSHDLVNMFGDIKFVVMGGTPKRMEQFAYFMASQLKHELPPGTILNDISKNSHRYSMFKVGPILSVSHGMGTPSIGILLHELIKLMSHANIKDPTFVRVGTCGGFNKKAGTVVVSNKVVNDFMEPFYELAILGKKIRFPANLDQNVVNEILSSSDPEDKFETVAGATYCTDNFYEGSGRADGAICEFSEQDGLNYYKELQKNGVVNMEMESLAFAALTCRAGIKSAIVTVILSDRLETDQIKQSKEVLDEWQTRPQRLLAKYIKKKLSISDVADSTSTTKLPSTSGTVTTAESTVCDSCRGTGIVESTTSLKPTSTRAYSTTVFDVSQCKSCGGAGRITNSAADTPGVDGSTTPSCTAGTSTTTTTSTAKPNIVASSTATTCKSCGGSGIEKRSDIGISAVKPEIGSPSTTSNSTACKPCGGVGKIESGSDAASIPTNFASTTAAPGSGTCPTCKGTGKEIPVADAAKPTSRPSLVPKCTGSFDSSANTTKSSSDHISTSAAPSVCKSCLGSGKSSDANTSAQAPSTTTSSPNMVVCKCCGGAGVVPIDKASDAAIPTIKPFFTAGSSVRKSDLDSSNKDGQTAASNASSVCKPCTAGGSGSTPRSDGTTTAAPQTQATSTSTVCKPCIGTGTGTASAAVGSRSSTSTPGLTTTLAPRVDSSSVCKPCIGSSTTTSGSTTTTSSSTATATSASTTTSAPTRKGFGPCPCNSGSAPPPPPGTGSSTTTSTSTTSAPYLAGSGPCKPCASGSTPPKSNASTPSALNSTTELPAYVCKPCISSANLPPGAGGGTAASAAGGASTCKPGSNPPTSSQYAHLPAAGGPTFGTTPATTTGAASSSTTTSQPSIPDVGICPRNTGCSTFGTTTSPPCLSVEALCRRNTRNVNSATTGGTSTCKPGSSPPTAQYRAYDGTKPNSGEITRDSTTTPGATSNTPSTASPFGVCKPCSGGRATTPINDSTSAATKSAADGTSASEIQSTTSKPKTTSTDPDSTTSTTSQPSASGTDSNAADNATGTSQRKRSKCVPYTCYTPDKTETTPLPTTPKTYLAKDFDSSSKSTISNDSWRSCYLKCSSKEPSSGGGILSSSKPQSFQTPEQEKLKGVPPALGPCCMPKDAIEFREVPQAKGRACVACEKRKDSNVDETKTTESSLEKQTSKDQIKTESPVERRLSIGPVKVQSALERRPSMGPMGAKSLLKKSPATDQVKTESSLERRTSSDVTRAPTSNDQIVDSKLGPCCTGQNKEVTPQPVTSDGNKLGSCCSGLPTVKPEEAATMRPVDSNSTSTCSGSDNKSQESSTRSEKSEARSNGGSKIKSTGRLCRGNEEDSPDEDCGALKKPQTTTNAETDSKPNALGQLAGNTPGCPISIRGPCIYRKDNDQSQGTSTSSKADSSSNSCGTNSTPKPSPDTPDTSTTRSMPTFVTPTPPSSTGIVCYSKFTNSNGVLVTSSISKEANKYDESPSPCAACKKYQESKKRSNDLALSESQPEIIKCPHKLKRLKDECQGYD